MKKYRDEDYLRREYIQNQKSSYDIAEDCGAHPTTIQRWLEKKDIEKRLSNSEKPGCFRHRSDGYGVFRDNSGEGSEERVLIHRLQAVAKYGFEEVKDKQVHHKNGVKWDNRFSNIEVLSNSEHQKLHAPNGVKQDRNKSIDCWPDRENR